MDRDAHRWHQDLIVVFFPVICPIFLERKKYRRSWSAGVHPIRHNNVFMLERGARDISLIVDFFRDMCFLDLPKR